ncbi:MAG: hypothetical protein E6H07_19810 [Bacteroidetes bacterium]|nr:MAG: hypothetical protein E6H07_19810 [Bacteroidota bacterium]
MKAKITVTIMILTVFVISSCSKDGSTYSGSGSGSPVLPPPPPPNQEVFYNQPWDTASNGYKLQINTQRLTQEQIIRGINVEIAVLGAGESPWVRIPVSYFDPNLTDTVHISYSATPGQLQLFARTTFELNHHQSDVLIKYK